jgi:hypothetical protein
MKLIVLLLPLLLNQASAQELIKVQKKDYQINQKAGFCLRPLEMMDTIVIHHSETPVTDTPEIINQMHLGRGTPEEPWHMVAYHYVINSPYAGDGLPIPQISEGRPLHYVGAHAGAQAFVKMNPEQKKLWDEGKIKCGKKGEAFSVHPGHVQGENIKANVTTVGVVVIGNYALLSPINPDGYTKEKPHIASENTLDMVARLSCQLQKSFPRIKNIMWHAHYNKEKFCPGDLKDSINKIKSITKRYGCEFN